MTEQGFSALLSVIYCPTGILLYKNTWEYYKPYTSYSEVCHSTLYMLSQSFHHKQDSFPLLRAKFQNFSRSVDLLQDWNKLQYLLITFRDHGATLKVGGGGGGGGSHT